MPGWFLSHSEYPAGYHCDPEQPLPFVSVASQKNHVGIYLFCIYCDPKEQALFVSEWKQTGCRLDEPHESFRDRRRSLRKPASTASCTSPHRYQTPAQ